MRDIEGTMSAEGEGGGGACHVSLLSQCATCATIRPRILTQTQHERLSCKRSAPWNGHPQPKAVYTGDNTDKGNLI